MTSKSNNDQLTTHLNYAYRLLAKRNYFTGEIQKKLLGKGCEKHVVLKIIERLNELKYLNDMHTLESYTKEIKTKRKGPHYLKQKLYEKSCAELLTNTALRELYPVEEEIEIIKKVIPSLKGTREKIMRKLSNRGFTVEAIMRTMNE